MIVRPPGQRRAPRAETAERQGMHGIWATKGHGARRPPPITLARVRSPEKPRAK
jgi:hypothetical protein